MPLLTLQYTSMHKNCLKLLLTNKTIHYANKSAKSVKNGLLLKSHLFVGQSHKIKVFNVLQSVPNWVRIVLKLRGQSVTIPIILEIDLHKYEFEQKIVCMGYGEPNIRLFHDM